MDRRALNVSRATCAAHAARRLLAPVPLGLTFRKSSPALVLCDVKSTVSHSMPSSFAVCATMKLAAPQLVGV